MKELTTQFSISKKRDISTRSEMGMFTAAKFLDFNGASFKVFATTEEASAAVECLIEQNSKKFKFDKKTEDSPFAQLVKHRYTRTHRASSPTTACLTSNLARLVPRPSSLEVFMKEPSAIEGGSSPKVCVSSRSARRVSDTFFTLNKSDVIGWLLMVGGGMLGGL